MNRQLWDMYKSSDRGHEMINLFSFYSDKDIEMFEHKLESLFNRFSKETDIDNFFNWIYLTNVNIMNKKVGIQENENVKDFYLRFIEIFDICIFDEDENGNLNKSLNPRNLVIHKQEYRKICAIINSISINMYLMYPQFFFPILNNERFDILVRNCDTLEIDLPNIPSRYDKKSLVMYYYDICESLNTFSKEYDLSAEELSSCVYDFATMLQNDSEIKKILPEPTNVWFTGASNSDYKSTFQNLTPETVKSWACNEATKKGDIIVIYCLSPQSYIHSIWRANSDGVVNPFSYYYSRATVTNPIKIPQITYAELKNDQYWSNVPIVRKNLQGINGIQLTVKDYNELLRLISSKGFNTSLLPKLYSPDIEIYDNLILEKDVEEKLLIPLLLELGYTNEDWKRQLSQKAGRGLKAIPDFVFFPKGEKHFQNAPFVLEVKFHMNSSNERMNAFNQVLSYCKMMSAELLGLCDKERLFVYRRKNGVFDRFNPIFEKHWGNIKNPETFAELKRIIGKDTVVRIN
jgi:hypothetical protein